MNGPLTVEMERVGNEARALILFLKVHKIAVKIKYSIQNPELEYKISLARIRLGTKINP